MRPPHANQANKQTRGRLSVFGESLPLIRFGRHVVSFPGGVAASRFCGTYLLETALFGPVWPRCKGQYNIGVGTGE